MLRIAGGPAMRSGELCGRSAADTKSKIKAGADLVQIYTGLIYRGPGLVPKIGKALKGWRPAGRRQR